MKINGELLSSMRYVVRVTRDNISHDVIVTENKAHAEQVRKIYADKGEQVKLLRIQHVFRHNLPAGAKRGPLYLPYHLEDWQAGDVTATYLIIPQGRSFGWYSAGFSAYVGAIRVKVEDRYANESYETSEYEAM